MALKKTHKIKDSDAAIVADAYSRIKALRFDHPSRVWVEVGVYADADDNTLLDTVEHTFTVADFAGKENINAGNAYGLLKSLERWSDAADV